MSYGSSLWLTSVPHSYPSNFPPLDSSLPSDVLFSAMSGERIYIDREGMRRAMGEYYTGPLPVPEESLQNEVSLSLAWEYSRLLLDSG